MSPLQKMATWHAVGVRNGEGRLTHHGLLSIQNVRVSLHHSLPGFLHLVLHLLPLE